MAFVNYCDSYLNILTTEHINKRSVVLQIYMYNLFQPSLKSAMSNDSCFTFLYVMRDVTPSWNFIVSRLAEIFKSPSLRHICGIRAVSRVVLWTALFFSVRDYHWQTAGRILDETTLCNRFQNSNDLHSQNTDRP